MRVCFAICLQRAARSFESREFFLKPLHFLVFRALLCVGITFIVLLDSLFALFDPKDTLRHDFAQVLDIFKEPAFFLIFPLASESSESSLIYIIGEEPARAGANLDGIPRRRGCWERGHGEI